MRRGSSQRSEVQPARKHVDYSSTPTVAERGVGEGDVGGRGHACLTAAPLSNSRTRTEYGLRMQAADGQQKVRRVAYMLSSK